MVIIRLVRKWGILPNGVEGSLGKDRDGSPFDGFLT